MPTSIDPAFDMPAVNWGQQGSYVIPQEMPSAGPLDGTLYQLPCLSLEWILFVMGCLTQLHVPSTWTGVTDAQQQQIQYWTTQLEEAIWSAVGTACVNPVINIDLNCVNGLQYQTADMVWHTARSWDDICACIKGCVTPLIPPSNPALTPHENACGIATYLADQLHQATWQHLADARAAGENVDQWIKSAIADVTAFAPILEFVTGPLSNMFNSSGTITVTILNTIASDAALWDTVHCVIYSAILSVGYVDDTNFAAVGSGLAAISYSPALVATILSNFWTDLGLYAVQKMQDVGALTEGDCSDCGGSTWCHYFDFTLNSEGWTNFPGYSSTYVAGVGWQSGPDPGVGGIDALAIVYDLGATYAITEIQIYMTSNNGSASGQPHIVAVSSAPGTAVCTATVSQPANYPAYAWQSGATACSGRYLQITQMTGSAGGGHVLVAGCQVRGTGTNPFGGSNCIVGP